MRLYVDKTTAREEKDGSIVYMSGHGTCAILSKVANCLCEDGKRRSVRITAQEADTAWTIRAETTVGKKTVRGYLTGRKGYNFFVAVSSAPNWQLIPVTMCQKTDCREEAIVHLYQLDGLSKAVGARCRKCAEHDARYNESLRVGMKLEPQG